MRGNFGTFMPGMVARGDLKRVSHFYRDGFPIVYLKVKTQLERFIRLRAHPVVVYRWLLCYMIDLPKKNLTDFVLIRPSAKSRSKITKAIVERMNKLGVKITCEDRFGYVFCKDMTAVNSRRLTHKAYEVSYFRQSVNLEIDYACYIRSLIPLEEMLSQLEPLNPTFKQLEYRGKGPAKMTNLVDNPFRTISDMFTHDELDDLLKRYDEIASYVLVEEFFKYEESLQERMEIENENFVMEILTS